MTFPDPTNEIESNLGTIHAGVSSGASLFAAPWLEGDYVLLSVIVGSATPDIFSSPQFDGLDFVELDSASTSFDGNTWTRYLGSLQLDAAGAAQLNLDGGDFSPTWDAMPGDAHGGFQLLLLRGVGAVGIGGVTGDWSQGAAGTFSPAQRSLDYVSDSSLVSGGNFELVVGYAKVLDLFGLQDDLDNGGSEGPWADYWWWYDGANNDQSWMAPCIPSSPTDHLRLLEQWDTGGDLTALDYHYYLNLVEATAEASSPWILKLWELDGSATTLDPATFKAARVTWATDGSGALEVDLRERDVSGGDWLYGRRRVSVHTDDDTRVYWGWLDHLERTGAPKDGPDGQRYRAASRGLSAVLDEKIVHGDFTEAEVVDTTVATDLIAHAVAQAFDHTGFTVGTITGVGASRTRYFCDGDNIGDAIREVAEMGVGFSWEIGPDGEFNAWVGGRGSDFSGSVTLSPSDCQDWECVGDTSDLRTYITGLGDTDDSEPCGPPLVVDWIGKRATYGRREGVLTDVSEDEGEMEEKTSAELDARDHASVDLRTTWIEGLGPWDFGVVGLGDVVNAELGAAFGGDADVRCIGISVTLESRFEFVEMQWEAA